MNPENLNRAIEIKKQLDELDQMRNELIVMTTAPKGRAFVKTNLKYDIELTGHILDQVVKILLDDFNSRTELLTTELETL